VGEVGSALDFRPFETTSEIISALRRARDFYDPVTTSLMIIRKNNGSRHDEPFRRGFLTTFEERAYLIGLFRVLEDREQTLLLLWFLGGVPVAQIARRLRMSRVHCYRIKERALHKLLKASKGETPAESQHMPHYHHAYQAQAASGNP
jgi:sigma-70-like protein